MLESIHRSCCRGTPSLVCSMDVIAQSRLNLKCTGGTRISDTYMVAKQMP